MEMVTQKTILPNYWTMYILFSAFSPSLLFFFCNTNKRSNLRSGYLFNILRIFLSLSSSTHFLVSTPIKTTNIIIGVFLQQQHSMHIQNQTTIYHTSIVWSELRAPDKDNYLHAKMRENDEYFFDEILSFGERKTFQFVSVFGPHYDECFRLMAFDVHLWWLFLCAGRMGRRKKEDRETVFRLSLMEKFVNIRVHCHWTGSKREKMRAHKQNRMRF